MFRKSFMVMLLFGITFQVIPSVKADVMSENDVKAAYIFNFAKFVEWPEKAFASKSAPIVLCVLGDDSLGDALQNLEAKKIKGRSLSVVRTRSKEQIRSCHILYISESVKKEISDILSKTGGRPCLTVSSVNEFAAQGGMIGFVRKGNKVRFEVNPDAIRRGELMVSSRLLNLATIVREP